MRGANYLAIVVELINREVVRWSMDSTITTKIVIDAFNAVVECIELFYNSRHLHSTLGYK